MHSPFQCSKVRSKTAYLQTMYLDCVRKWVRSCEQIFGSESKRARLYSVKVIKTSWLAIYRLFILSMVAKRIASLLRNRPWNTLHNFFVLRHARCWERTTSMHPHLHLKSSHFFYCACPISSVGVWFWNFLSASDRNHGNRPNISYVNSRPGFRRQN